MRKEDWHVVRKEDGHVVRKEDGHVLRKTLEFEGQRKKGRPKRIWEKQVE